MIIVYKTLTETEIRRDARSAIRKINKWFKQNPQRTDCNVETWYGGRTVVPRGKVSAAINAAAAAAIKGK
jgi:hypothetical protein